MENKQETHGENMNTKSLGIICGGIFFILVVILGFLTLTKQIDPVPPRTHAMHLEDLKKEKCDPRLAYASGQEMAGEEAYMLYALAILASYSDADSEKDVELRNNARAARTEAGKNVSAERRQEIQKNARKWHENHCPALVQ